MDKKSTNELAPAFGPTFPVNPHLRQMLRITQQVGPVYLGFTQQWNTTNFRDREPCYTYEPNGIALAGTVRGRLVGNYGGLPLYVVTLACCAPVSSFSSVSLSSTSVSSVSSFSPSSVSSVSPTSVSVSPSSLSVSTSPSSIFSVSSVSPASPASVPSQSPSSPVSPVSSAPSLPSAISVISSQAPSSVPSSPPALWYCLNPPWYCLLPPAGPGP